MKKKLRTPLYIVLTVLITISLLIPAGSILQHKLSYKLFLDRENNREFYTLEENSIDLLCIGSSQILSGFCTPVVAQNYGISTFALGNCWQNMHGAYYWLKECLSCQQPDMIILEVSSLYGVVGEESYIRAYSEMKNTSPIKLEALLSLDLSPEEFLGYYSFVYKYHERFSSLQEYDFSFLLGKNKKTVGGFAITTDKFNKYELDDDTFMLKGNAEPEEPEEINRKYFIKFIEYCINEETELLLFKTVKREWTEGQHATVKNFADEYGLTFIDMNEEKVLKELKLDYSEDMLDPDHLNYYGALKISDYLGKYITENYSITRDKSDNYVKELCSRFEKEVRLRVDS